jgi:hypothetical protein
MHVGFSPELNESPAFLLAQTSNDRAEARCVSIDATS